MHNILRLAPRIEGAMVYMKIVGYDEDNGVMFLYEDGGVYKVELKSMQSRKLYETRRMDECHPFTSLYTPGDCSSFVIMHL